MKVRPLVSLVCSISLLTGCTFDSASPLLLRGNDTVQTNKIALTDSDIIAELMVLNKAEIAAAELAKTQATHSSVKKYASYLYTQHSDNLSQTLALSQKTGISPRMNTKALSIQRQGTEELAQLKTYEQHAFDKAYIKAMISDHKNALRLLDKDIELSTNAALTKLLKATRIHVAMHLQKAKQIQTKLK